MPENTQRQRGGEAHTLSRHVIVKSKISTAKRYILNLFLVVELWPFMCYSEMGLWGLCKGSKVERWPWNRRGGRVDKLEKIVLFHSCSENQVCSSSNDLCFLYLQGVALAWLVEWMLCIFMWYCEKKKRILVSQICAHLMCACQFDGLKKIWVFKLRILIHYHWKFQKVKRKNDPPFSTFFWHQTSIGCRSVNTVMKKLWL